MPAREAPLKLHLGKPVHSPLGPPEGEGWRRIHSPGPRLGLLAACLAGLLLPTVLCLGLGALSWLASRSMLVGSAGPGSAPWIAPVLPLLLTIPLHELLHAAGYPDHGLSSKTMLIVWPARLLFAVYYDGCMSRRRWLAMRLAPAFFLSLVPAGLLALFHYVPVSAGLDIALQVLMLVNGIGSGADLVAAVIVWRQAPAGAVIGFHGGRAYWRPADILNDAKARLFAA